MKMEQHQVEAACVEPKREIGGGVQQKSPSKLNYQDRCFRSMNNYFIHSSSYHLLISLEMNHVCK